MDEDEIVIAYRTAKDRSLQIEILADLNDTDVNTVINVIQRHGENTSEILKNFGKCSMCGRLIYMNRTTRRCEECATAIKYLRYQERHRKKARYKYDKR